MSRKIRMELTEIYVFDIEDGGDGTDAVSVFDHMTSQEHAFCYEQRSARVEDFHTGEQLHVATEI